MDWSNILQWYFILFFVTFPITYIIITELLDLIFNSARINQLLKHSDSIDISPLEKQYTTEKDKQLQISKSDLMELERQINYVRMTERITANKWSDKVTPEEQERLTAAKKISDIFKLK
ncbi:MAG: hypothetical protein JST94_07770 [Bacteroidetes bacterium]|nr:hypothetical protein [Bacteroidota bacterium]